VSKVRVLQFSPHDENDGIARYEEQYVKALSKIPEVETAFFGITPFQLRKSSEAEKQQTGKQQA